MVLIGFICIILGMFWFSYKAFTSWIPFLLLITGVLMMIDFVIDHWVFTLFNVVIAVLLFALISSAKQNGTLYKGDKFYQQPIFKYITAWFITAFLSVMISL